MDFEESEKAALVLSKLDLKKNYSQNLFFPTSKQFHETCATQKFPFRMTLMKYIWTNPSSAKVYSKMIKCCKIFFIKNPILVYNNLFYREDKGLKNNFGIHWERLGYPLNNIKGMDIHKITQKIWLTGQLTFTSCEYLSKPPSDFISKIERYDVTRLVLHRQCLSYDDLKFYSNGIKECIMKCCLIKYENEPVPKKYLRPRIPIKDMPFEVFKKFYESSLKTEEFVNGPRVPVEDIMKVFSSCKKLLMNFNRENYTPCKNYAELVNACNIFEEVEFYEFPYVFDVAAFFEQLKIKQNRALMKFYTRDPNGRFDPIIDEILVTKEFDYVPPVLCYYDDGSNDRYYHCYDKEYKMKEIQADAKKVFDEKAC